MNYLKIYIKLMRKAQNRLKPDGYTEKHHIFPQSIFGKNKSIVNLTAREHFISHFLLLKIYKKRCGYDNWKTKCMLNSVWICSFKNDIKINSRIFENLRIIKALETSKLMKNKIVSLETREKISKNKKENKCWVGENNPKYGKGQQMSRKKSSFFQQTSFKRNNRKNKNSTSK